MMKTYKIFFLIISLLLSINVIGAENDYFQSLKQIKQIPSGSVPVLPCSLEEKKHVLILMKQNNISDFEDVKFTENGNLYNRWKEEIEIYKGDFSNEGVTEYALITTGGTMHANTVRVYKVTDGRLVDADLDQKIIQNLLTPGSDMSRFYLHVANPFAYMKDGKTYLRFMSYPGNREYDKTKLELCTYLWQDKKMSLVGPNWTYIKSSDHLVEAKNCIGHS